MKWAGILLLGMEYNRPEDESVATDLQSPSLRSPPFFGSRTEAAAAVAAPKNTYNWTSLSLVVVLRTVAEGIHIGLSSVYAGD